MSRTTTVRFGDRSFWTWDDSVGVWMAYLAEEIDRLEEPPADLACLADNLHVWSLAIDLARGSLTEEQLRSWIAVDDLPVAKAFSRSGTGVVEIDRVLDVADTTIALMLGILPPDPPGGLWFVGHGGEVRVTKVKHPPPIGPG